MDFRDPKLCITPDGRLMLSIGVSIYRDKKLITQIPHVCFSKNGKDFTEPQKCTIEEQQEHKTDWVWRTTWHEGKGYATDYFTKSDGSRGICIVTTKDGIKYAKLCELNIPDFPNEATIRFLPSGKMALMVRRDEGDCLGYWALSEAPFTKWEWKKMPFRLGGPDFLMLNDTEIIATSRCHHIPDRCTTAVYTGNAQTATFEQKLILPSSGDTSYGGMLIEGDEVWISYYSCHETKWPGIYLAKIPLSYFKWQKRN